VALEMTSIVCGVGTGADCGESDVEWDTTDGGDCTGLTAVIGTGSVFIGGGGIISGRSS